MTTRLLLLLAAFATLFAGLPVSAPRAQTITLASSAIERIAVEGNQRIEASTILSYLALREGTPYSAYEADVALKNLYATGFFADIRITPEETTNGGIVLRVSVAENPIINQVAFEGNEHTDDKDLENEIELKPRSIYTRNRIQNDVKRILDIYRRSGRYSAQVEPKVITLDQNRVNLVFEINEGEVSRVEKITFIGNERFSTKTLRNAIRTEESTWYKFLTDNDKYDPDRLQYDQELLRRFYNSEGYADFQIKSAIAELTPSRDAFYITFTIEEGPRYNFGPVDLVVNLKGVDPEALKNTLSTHQGEVYNAAQVESSIDTLTKALGDRGYAFVDIDPQMKRDPAKQEIAMVYRVKEGPRVYVERINIGGNSRTLDEVIRREFRLAEGDAYSASKLARTEQRLNNLGFFEKVEIKTEQGSRPDRTVINVNVTEKSTGEISFGAGFSTQDGALADFGIREKNFLGKGQELRFKGTIAARRQQYDIGFTEPYFLNRELSAGFDLFRTTQDLRRESSFDRASNGGALRLGYALSEKWSHSLNYTYRRTNITNVDPAASLYIRQQEGETTNSSVGHSLTYEDRDNKFDPSTGGFFQIAQEVAGLGGSTHYLRHEAKAAWYYPVYEKWVLSVSGMAGHMVGLGEDVRIQDRFFIGGRNFRGFNNAGIGPRDSITRDALGGTMYYVTSTEMTFPLGLSEDLGLRGAVFTDVGSLWNADVNGVGIVDDSTPRVTAGVGLLWSSPFGPIRIDIAKAIVKETLDETEMFQFSFGTRF